MSGSVVPAAPITASPMLGLVFDKATRACSFLGALTCSSTNAECVTLGSQYQA